MLNFTYFVWLTHRNSTSKTTKNEYKYNTKFQNWIYLHWSIWKSVSRRERHGTPIETYGWSQSKSQADQQQQHRAVCHRVWRNHTVSSHILREGWILSVSRLLFELFHQLNTSMWWIQALLFLEKQHTPGLFLSVYCISIDFLLWEQLYLCLTRLTLKNIYRLYISSVFF